jgi:ELWxxDGT repeat protein
LDSAIGSQAGSNFDHEPAQFDRSKIKSEETPMKSFVPRRPSRLATLSALLTVVVLWQTSAQAQVYLVKDINDSGGSGIIRSGASGSVVFFSADDGTNGEELWRSDGTEVGTYLVKDIWPDTEPDDTNAFSSKPEQFAAAGGYMYFAASGREDPNPPYFDDYEVWVTDGTGGGTASLDIWSGVQSSGPSNFVSMGGSVFVSAYDETYGNEVIKVSAGSGSVLKDIETGVGNSTPNQLAVVHLSGPDAERLLFSASTFALGPELWISDGTEGGTLMVKDRIRALGQRRHRGRYEPAEGHPSQRLELTERFHGGRQPSLLHRERRHSWVRAVEDRRHRGRNGHGQGPGRRGWQQPDPGAHQPRRHSVFRQLDDGRWRRAVDERRNR